MFSGRTNELRLIRDSRLLDAKLLDLPDERTRWRGRIPAELVYLNNKKYWRKPTSSLFDGGYYLDRYDDVREAGECPLLHFLRHGFREGRSPCAVVDMDYIVRQMLPADNYMDGDDFIKFKLEQVGRYTDLRDLLLRANADPCLLFSNSYYREVNGLNYALDETIPVEHYLNSNGRRNGGDGFLECSPRVDLAFYMKKYPDLVEHNVIPLVHLLWYGMAEGRKFSPNDCVLQSFLNNTASLLDDDSVKNLKRFVNVCGKDGRLAGPCWPTEFTERSMHSLAHKAKTELRPRAFIGVVLYENDDEQILRLQQSIDHEISAAEGVDIEYLYLANDSHNLERYRGFLREEVIVSPDGENIGFGRGHNLLMERCFNKGGGLYIGANPDGYFVPGCIQSLIDFSDYHSGSALIEASAFPIDHPKWHDPVTFDTAWVSCACFALTRGLWSELGGFDEEIHMYCEDVDLSWRAKLLGASLKVCPTARFVHDVTPRFTEDPKSGAAKIRRKAMLSGGYYLARKWGNDAQADKLRRHLLAEGFLPDQIAEMDPGDKRVDAEVARKVADFTNPRFAPSRFW